MSSLVYFRSAPSPHPHLKPHGPKRRWHQHTLGNDKLSPPRSQISSNRILLKCSVQLFQVQLQKAAQHHYQSTQQSPSKTTTKLFITFSALLLAWYSLTCLVWAKMVVLLSPLTARLQLFTAWCVSQRSAPSCELMVYPNRRWRNISGIYRIILSNAGR